MELLRVLRAAIFLYAAYAITAIDIPYSDLVTVCEFNSNSYRSQISFTYAE